MRLEVKLERSLGRLQIAPITDGLGKRYGTFSGWGMAAGKVEVLLVVGGFDVDGGAEVRLVNKDVNSDLSSCLPPAPPVTPPTSSPALSVIPSMWARLEIVCPLE